MKELKVRAFDRIQNIMLPAVKVVYFTAHGPAYTEPQRFCENLYPAVMQYIGLSDKNSKEIYEEDILTTEDSTHTYIVRYSGNAFVLLEINLTEQRQDFDRFTIIGNAHENPELIAGSLASIVDTR